MTETERLRALLDGRGVKWWPLRDGGYYEDRDTEFVVDGKKHTAHQWGDGFAVYGLTAQQAVDATLGRGECDAVYDGDLRWKCESCGEHWQQESDERNFCPRCGREIRR